MKCDSLYSAMDKYNKLYSQVMRTPAYLEAIQAIQSSALALKTVEQSINYFSQIFAQTQNVALLKIQHALDLLKESSVLTLLEAQRNYEASYLQLSESIKQAFSNAVEVSTPYIDSETLDDLLSTTITPTRIAHRTEVDDKNGPSKWDIISLVSTWISILVTIYCTIISALPNDQLDRIATQNEVIMTQQEEILEKDRELQHTLDTISDTVNLLTEEVEILRDELEHIDDSSIQEDRPEILDSQQSDSDIQE